MSGTLDYLTKPQLLFKDKYFRDLVLGKIPQLSVEELATDKSQIAKRQCCQIFTLAA